MQLVKFMLILIIIMNSCILKFHDIVTINMISLLNTVHACVIKY